VSTVRLFVAIETIPEIQDRLAEVQKVLRATHVDVHWEAKEKLHVTLKFLGATETSVVEPLTRDLRAVCAAIAQPTIHYGDLGFFPSRGTPRVVWAGVDDIGGGVKKLFQGIEDVAERHGFARESRAFHPHITLGRIKGKKNLRTLLTSMETITLESQPVELHEILLMKSDLRPNGSIYSTVASFPLGT